MRPIAPVPHVCRPTPARSWLGRKLDAFAGAVFAPLLVLGALGALLVTRLAAVGVVVNTGARPGSTLLDRRPGSTYFVAGLTERGDTTKPVLIRSMAEYEALLGARVTYGYLYDDLTTFFAEGGERAYVSRVVGAAATKGTKTLNDRAGAPLPTIVLTAKSAGAWSSSMTVEVVDGNVTNTFSIRLYLSGVLVETYADMATPALAVAAINGSSMLVTATDSGSVTVAPNNNPAVLAPAAFSAGNDDRGSVVSGDYVTALARFGRELGTGFVAIPGFTSAQVGAGIAAHLAAYRRVGGSTVAAGANVATAKAAATALRSTTGAEALGIFYRWITVPDGAGGIRTISPEGYVAAQRARAFRTAGPWRAPAGELAVARYATGTEGTVLTAAEVNDLIEARVNPIRQIGSTTRLYGWRSLSTDPNYKLLTARDTLNVVAQRAEAALEQFVYSPVDGAGRLFSAIEQELVGILDPYRAAGGLYERLDPDDGTLIDPGYVIDTGPAVNTTETLGDDEVRANVALRLSPAAELITITVTKVAFDASLGTT